MFFNVMLYDLAFQVLSLVSHHPFFCTFSSQRLPLSPLYQPCSCLFFDFTHAVLCTLNTCLFQFTSYLTSGLHLNSTCSGKSLLIFPARSVCLPLSLPPPLPLTRSLTHSLTCSRIHNCKLLYNIVYVFAFHCTYHSYHFTFMCMNSCRDGHSHYTDEC